MASVKQPMTRASAPPTAPAKAAPVRRSMLVQESSVVSIRREDRASMRAGMGAPLADVSRAQMARAARSLAMETK